MTPQTDYQREREAIDALFTKARHVPQFVVCSDCQHGPGFPDIAHNYAGGEDAACVWPCNHEVTPGDRRCLICLPLADDERDPWDPPCGQPFTTYYSTPGICALASGHTGGHARPGEPGWESAGAQR